MANNLLKGKKGVIFGALNESSIAWKAAIRAHEEGAQFVLTNSPLALKMGEINKLAELVNAEVIPADASNINDLKDLFSKSTEILGGKLDFVLHSIGMSPNVRKNIPYDGTNYDNFMKTLDVSAVSFHKVMQAADQTDSLNEWASILALSYIAAQRSFPGYGDMGDAKALLESIARSFGSQLGQKLKVRVNTISQSPTPTTAGQGIGRFDVFFKFTERMSPLGNATAEACADYIVMMFSDLTRYVTMQNLFHDGGFATSGITEDIVALFPGEHK